MITSVFAVQGREAVTAVAVTRWWFGQYLLSRAVIRPAEGFSVAYRHVCGFREGRAWHTLS